MPRVLIGRTFKYEKEDMIFVKGKDYPVKKELAEFIARKRLGMIIPEVKTNTKGKSTLKEVLKPPRDKMIRREKVETK